MQQLKDLMSRDVKVIGPDMTISDAARRIAMMSDGIVCAYEDDSVEQAAKIKSERQVRRLPVVDCEKRLVGIVALGEAWQTAWVCRRTPLKDDIGAPPHRAPPH